MSAEQLKQQGIKQAADNAGKVWQREAFEAFKIYLETLQVGDTLISEDFRSWVIKHSWLQSPPHERAYSCVILKAKKEGLISHTGNFIKTTAAHCHQSRSSQWRKN